MNTLNWKRITGKGIIAEGARTYKVKKHYEKGFGFFWALFVDGDRVNSRGYTNQKEHKELALEIENGKEYEIRK